MNTANERIKSLRINNCMTQSQLGDVLGIGQKTISMIENGDSNPTVKQLETLSIRFNVSIDYLVTGKESFETINSTEQEILEMLRNDNDAFKAMRELVEMKKKLFSKVEQHRYNVSNDSVVHG